ncbi:outer membrane beta-barrel protein [Niastella sp. OAS944]|uniref:outer membrane beta-barrel protein n=1 Tax=Niastella sp. OAS944 TaxID=2664089 RepID=UPI0034843CE4|nr:hypothetical protein [Chitinophagaceae bacterium OAS944]
MKPILILLTLAFISIPASFVQAQNANGRISGMITNVQNNPLPGASVTLFKPAAPAFNKTIAVGEDGRFAFKKLYEGQYIMIITNVGFKKYVSDTFTIDAGHHTLLLPVIVLQHNAQKALKEVVVGASKPLLEHKIDRTIVNVDAMLTVAGSNALEVLARSPGVRVQPDGDISLYQKDGVLVLIDNKPTYLSAQELAAYLRSLPAGILDKVELISNPPAQYDASGGAIINIRLKKNRALGFNGSMLIAYNQGRYQRNNEAIMLNYRKKKINLFANLSHARDGNYNRETNNRYYYNTNGSPQQSLLINKWYTFQSDGINVRTGLDYFVSANTTVGILFTGGVRPRSDQLSYNSNSIASGTMHGNYPWYSGGINMNVLHTFNRKGTTLSSDLDVVTLHADGNQYLSTQVMYNLPADINIMSAKADYNMPLNKKIKLEAGLKSSYVRTQYNNDWYNKTADGYTPDYGNTNHFKYSENINAGYVSIAKEWRRWSAKAGVRIENTNMHGRQLPNIVIPDSSFSRNYTNLFPDCYLQYKLDSNNNNIVTLSYSQRIRRPNYQQLNPFLFYNDKYSYSAGNPALTPQYFRGIELRYTYKNRLGLVAGYLYTSKLIQSLIEVSGSVNITRPQNFGVNHALTIYPFVQLMPFKGWQLNAGVALFHLENRGIAYEQTIDNDITTFEMEMTNQFRFSKSWSAELSGMYSGARLAGQTRTSPIWRADVAVQKTVFKEKGSIKLNMTDIFHSMIRRDQFSGLLLMQSQRRLENDTQRLGISLSYRFGDTNSKKRSNQHTGSAAEEQGRL